MKAITLWQPWATMMALGVKAFETRSWSTDHRGRIAVHAAASEQAWARDKFWEEPFLSVLVGAGYEGPEHLPRGVILSVHELKGCYATPTIRGTTTIYAGSVEGHLKIPPSWPESALGDYSPGRYAWHMPLGWALDVPISIRGRQRLWEWKGE